MTQRRPTSNLPGRVAGDEPAPAASPAEQPGDGGRLLADALRVNALFSGASGVLLLVGGVALGPWLAVDTWILAVMGVGLALFAALILGLLSRPRRLVTGARWVVAADATWVVGAAALLTGLPSALSAAGRAALVAATTVVAGIAVVQLIGLRRIPGRPITASSPVALQVPRVVAASAEQVWAAVADAGDYARFAPGITATSIMTGQREGMVRVCTDDRGGQWAETCTLWDEGHRYRMTVDVSSYPIYYRALLHAFAQTWTVQPTPDGTLLTLTFDGELKLGVLGRLAARLLGNPRRLDAILDAYEHELVERHQQRSHH